MIRHYTQKLTLKARARRTRAATLFVKDLLRDVDASVQASEALSCAFVYVRMYVHACIHLSRDVDASVQASEAL